MKKSITALFCAGSIIMASAQPGNHQEARPSSINRNQIVSVSGDNKADSCSESTALSCNKKIDWKDLAGDKGHGYDKNMTWF